jgi:ribosomal protein S7
MINHNGLWEAAARRCGWGVGCRLQDFSKGNSFLALRYYANLVRRAKDLKSRKGLYPFRIPPDSVYRSRLVSMLIHRVMRSGAIGSAKRIVYKALGDICRGTPAEGSRLALRRPQLDSRKKRRKGRKKEPPLPLKWWWDKPVGDSPGFGVVPDYLVGRRRLPDVLVRARNLGRSWMGPHLVPVRILGRAISNIVTGSMVKKKASKKGKRRRIKLVPYKVCVKRSVSVAFRWLVGAARGYKGRQPFYRKLCRIIQLSSEGRGGAVKKKDEMIKLVTKNTFKIPYLGRVRRLPRANTAWYRPDLNTRSRQEQNFQWVSSLICIVRI